VTLGFLAGFWFLFAGLNVVDEWKLVAVSPALTKQAGPGADVRTISEQCSRTEQDVCSHTGIRWQLVHALRRVARHHVRAIIVFTYDVPVVLMLRTIASLSLKNMLSSICHSFVTITSF
jgi:hypothetical protein